MKKGLILTIAAMLLLAGLAAAQMGGNTPGVCDGNGPHGMRGRGFDGPGWGMRGGMRGGQGGPMGMMGVLGMADDLELTDAQVDAIQKMGEDFRLQMIDHRAAVEKAELKLRSLQRDNASESAVGSAIDDLSKLRAQGQKMRYAHQQQVRAQLTVEQQQKLDQMRKQRPGRGRGMGNGPGRGQGRGMGNGQGRGQGPGGMGCIYGTRNNG